MKRTKILTIVLLGVGSVIFTSNIVTKQYEQVSYNDIDHSNTIENKDEKYIPNSPNWKDSKHKDISVDGYGNGSEFDFDDGYYPDNPNEYSDWFMKYHSDYPGFVGGGNQHDAYYDLKLDSSDFEVTEENGVYYQVEKIKINNFDVYMEKGGIVGYYTPMDWFSEHQETKSANEANGSIDDSSDGVSLAEDGLILEPNTGYTDIYTYDDGVMFENSGSTWNDVTVSYEWSKGSDTIRFKVSNLNDWVFALAGGDFTFATFIGVDYQPYIVDKDYKLSNDEFDLAETQKNFMTMNAEGFEDSGDDADIYFNNDKNHKVIPYWTSSDNYSKLKNSILNNNYFVSRDEIKTSEYPDEIGILFYDEEDEIISYDSNLSSPFVKISLYNKNSINEEGEYEDQTEIFTFAIPYFDGNFKGVGNNIYDFDFKGTYGEDGNIEDPTDNNTDYNWEYDLSNDKWVLKTNTPFEFVSNLPSDNISKISWKELGNETNNGVTNFDDGMVGERFITNDQITKNETNSFKYEIEFFDDRIPATIGDPSLSFIFDYNGVSDYSNNNLIITDLDGNELTNVNEEDVVIDVNGDGEIQSKEILRGYTVNESVKINSDYEVSYWEISDNKWKIINDDTLENYNEIKEPGIYGVRVIDEYGNNSFKVINYIDLSKTGELESFDKTEICKKDNEVFLEQDYSDEEKFSDMVPLEYRYLDDFISSEESGLKDIKYSLESEPLDTDKFISLTNKFEENTLFGEQVQITEMVNDEEITYSTSIKEELENEINKQLQDENRVVSFDESEYDIEWNISDNTYVNNDLENISFTIVPDGYWKSINEKTITFKPFTYYSLEQVPLDIEAIEGVSNKYLIGTNYSDSEVIDIDGNSISMKEAIESEIRDQLITLGYKPEYVNKTYINIDHSDIISNVYGEVSYGDKKLISIYSPMETSEGLSVFKGNTSFEIELKPRLDISKESFEIDNNKLNEISNRYFIGSQFINVKQELEDEIFNQVKSYANSKNIDLTREEVTITFAKSDYESITNNELIGYTINSTSSRLHGSYENEFMTNPFTSLSALRISTRDLIEITNKFYSGTTFKELKVELDKYLINDLERRGIDTSKVLIEWSLEEDDIVEYQSEISFRISPLDEEYVQGEYIDTFNAWTYYNLSVFVLNQDEINSILQPYINQGYVMFEELRISLEEELYKELEEQGFNIDIIDIDWNRGDTERVVLGQTITFEFSSINKFVVKGDFSQTFVFGEKIPATTSVNWNKIIIIFMILTVILIVVAVALIIKQKVRNRGI